MPPTSVLETVATDDDLTFADLGVPAALIASLHARRIDAPFPIQATTIPDALAGRDLCGRAPTGSGKTIAFGIPLVARIGRAKPKRPRGLVLVPTRELAAQVCHELQLLSKPKGPWVEAVYGGVGFDRQVSALRRGVDIIVACPGRLADLIQQGQVQLGDIEVVVLDEADRMADMGFLPEVRRLLDQCPTDRQTLLFSATLDGDVDVLIKKYQRDPIRHEHVVEEDDGVVEHLFWRADRDHRVSLAADVIKRLGHTVVFCRTKRGADRLAKQLGTFGVKAAAIHGDRSQNQREQALRSFHDGKVTALVATDVAARGIHVDGVAGVVHYDPPADHKDYVHRSGRTGRAGAQGIVVSLVLSDKRSAVIGLQRELGLPTGVTDPDLDLLAVAPAPVVERKAEPKTERFEKVEKPAFEKPRATKSKPERAFDKPAFEKPRTDRPHADTPRTERPRTEKPRTEKPKVERIGELTGRAVIADGKVRPSGAARRKAKKLAAAEAVRLGLEPTADREPWTDEQRRAARRRKQGGGTPRTPAKKKATAGRSSGGTRPPARSGGPASGAKHRGQSSAQRSR